MTGNETSIGQQWPIILDIGETFTRAGFANEACPRAFLMTPEGALAKSKPRLVEHLKNVLIDHLQIDPASSRGVVICEQSLWPRTVREGIVGSLLGGCIGVPRVSFVPSSICAAVAGSVSSPSPSTALVVDCGWSHTDVVPVIAGAPVAVGIRSSLIGVAAIAESLWRNVSWIGPRGSPSATSGNVCLSRELVSRFCLGCHSPALGVVPVNSASGQFTAEITAEARVFAVRSLARGGNGEGDVGDDDGDEDGESVAGLISESLMRSPVDTRRELVKNIVGSGGAWMIPGFDRAVSDALEEKFEAEPKLCGLKRHVGFIKPLFPHNLLAWVGAAAMTFAGSGTPKLFESCPGGCGWIRKSDTEPPGFCLPDWSSARSFR